LEAEDAGRCQTQGIVVSGFSDVPWAEALFLYAAHDGAAWINPLRAAAPITDAAGKEKEARAATLAFTCAGLATLGLPDPVLGTFSAPFREGMYQEDRLAGSATRSTAYGKPR
jgi:hypothetical protein